MQEDPYRIVIQTERVVNPRQLKDIILELAEKDVKKIIVEAITKTGLFKRRLIHVARKFGALSKWADFSDFSLKQLIRSFEKSVIFEEAVRDTLENDMDVEGTRKALNWIKNGDIEILIIEEEDLTPIARIGVERISRKTDLIPPEKMRSILIESTKARILNEVGVFVCLNCWEFLKSIRVRDLPEKVRCPKCGSYLAVSKETEDAVLKVYEKRGQNLRGKELEIYEELLETRRLVASYGYAAVLAYMGHRLNIEDVEEILAEHSKIDEKFYELIIEAERKALKGRFW